MGVVFGWRKMEREGRNGDVDDDKDDDDGKMGFFV